MNIRSDVVRRSQTPGRRAAVVARVALLALLGGDPFATISADAQEVVADGVIESTSGGFKHPDGTTQTTAFGPGTVGHAEVVAGEVQLRVTSGCVAGSSIAQINPDGSVICEPDDGEPGVLAGWERVSFEFGCDNLANCSVFVACSTGKKVLGGGLELPGLDHDGLGHLFTMTYGRPRDDTSWEVGGANDTGGSVTMRVWAVCAPALPETPFATTSIQLGPDEKADPLSSCLSDEGLCSITTEESNERTLVRLSRQTVDRRRELVLEDRQGRLSVVAGMLSASRSAHRVPAGD